MWERTFSSAREYADPFRDVDVDVDFTSDAGTWRVPAFWRGGSSWTVRFSPPQPGRFDVRVRSTSGDPDLDLHLGEVEIGPVGEPGGLRRRGAPRISQDGRTFEYADGTPFPWLADTWWSGLSGRLDWAGFQELAADRVAKGFTAVHICGGLVPHDRFPEGTGFANEGGTSWTSGFERIDPAFFDAADRRIEFLVDSGLVPVIVGGWREILAQMGVTNMKRHWRNLVARWGHLPVVWIVGGETYEPPRELHRLYPVAGAAGHDFLSPGWTDVLRHLRDIDPYHRLVSAHEIEPPFDEPVSDQDLLDFDFFQAGHSGWASLATGIALLGTHYARRTTIRPLVMAEIGYEGLYGSHLEDFQRMAFWSSVTNGAAGFGYGTIAIAIAYAEPGDHPPIEPPDPMTFDTWREAMHYPGSAQVGRSGTFLRRFPWHRIVPRPDWVDAGGTTLFEPNDQVTGYDTDLIADIARDPDGIRRGDLPAGEWRRRNGSFRRPYAAGIPGRLRLVYLPQAGETRLPDAPLLLGLEPDVVYRAFYWDPRTGAEIGLGDVSRAGPIDEAADTLEILNTDGTRRATLGPRWAEALRWGVEDRGLRAPSPPAIQDWVLVLENRDPPAG